jgi:ATP-binding cassette, subfamily B, multidrug efflux pump
MAGRLQTRTGTVQKPRDASRTLSTLGRYLLQSTPMLVLALSLSIAGNVFQLIGPTLCGRAIDAVSGGKGKVDFDTVYYYAIRMVGFYVASAVLAYIVPQIVLRISQRTVRTMRVDLFSKLMRLPVKYFDTHQMGETLSRISYDIDTVNTSLSNDLVQILTSIVTVVGALVMMIKISPLLVTVFVVTVPLSVLFTRFMTRRVRPLYHNRSKCLGAMNGFAEEYISGQKTIRAYHREEEVLARFDEKNEDAVNSYYKAEYYASSTGPSVNFINNLSLTLISIFGALMYLNGAITVGNISSHPEALQIFYHSSAHS